MRATLDQYVAQHSVVVDNTKVDPWALTSTVTKAWASNHGWGGVTFVECGDFLETFAGDARRVAEILELTYCRKDGLLMAGVPAHAFRRYSIVLAQAGIACRVVQYTPTK